MQKYLYIIIAGLAIAGALYLADMRTQSLERVADCVTATAKAQGYAGNVYSRDAWDLFAPSCN